MKKCPVYKLWWREPKIRGKKNKNHDKLIVYSHLPPVISHIALIWESEAEWSTKSLSTFPLNRKTIENIRWSQRNGSLVSSLPGKEGCIGRVNWKEINVYKITWCQKMGMARQFFWESNSRERGVYLGEFQKHDSEITVDWPIRYTKWANFLAGPRPLGAKRAKNPN